MKKGIRLNIVLSVTGEDEPADDFLKLVTGAVTWALQQIPLFPIRRGLSVEIEKVSENTEGDSEEEP